MQFDLVLILAALDRLAKAEEIAKTMAFREKEEVVEGWLQTQAVQLLRACSDSRRLIGRDPAQQERWRQRVKTTRGWTLERRPSAVSPEAGDGVYVQGEVPIGSVVALYAAVLYRNSSEFFQVFKPEDSSEYLMARYDGIIMDGIHGVGDTPEARDMEVFGLGEIINHPNEGQSPNVQTAQFKFPFGLAPDLAVYAPNRFHFKRPQGYFPNWASQVTAIPSIAMVASRNIEDGEELLLNYRLNPQAEVPEWYHPVDPEEDARRWS